MSYFFAFLFMFLVFWRPQEWLVPALYGWPILDAVVFLALLSLLLEINSGALRLPRDIPQLPLLLGLWVAAMFSHVAHTYFAGLMATMPEVFKVCFFTVLLTCVLDRPGRMRNFARVFVAMAVLMTIHALLQEQRGYGFAGSRPLWVPAMLGRAAHTRSRFFGIFSDPNDLAQMLATSIPFAFVLFKRRSLFSILVGGGVSWLLIQGILSTHSRGGQVALVAVCAMMAVLLFPARWQPVLTAAGGIGALAMCPMAAGWLDQSAHDRVVFWGMANEQFKSNPIFGVWHGMFWQITSNMTAHNAFVLCYTELGVVGYFFWFTILLLGLIGTWRARIALRSNRDQEADWLGRMAGLTTAATIGFSASSYFLSRTFIYPFFFLFAVMGAIPHVSRAYLPEEHEALIVPARDVGIWGAAGTLASIIYVYFSIVLLNRAFYE